ncbi:MAG: ABC transporter ATP-binding protein [Chitinophagales bacterium]|nr:ABC transporter ATP-binding protein [Chitinophagales bacterium]
MIHNKELQKIILRIKDVSKSFGNNLILKNVTGEIYDVRRPGYTQGQICAILGPSGIGKTTLFEIISGVIKPDTGEVFIADENTIENEMDTTKYLHPVETGAVGVVYQNYPLFEHLSVYDNLHIGAKKGGLSGKAAEDKILHYLDKFGIREHARKYPIQLSGGQRQRVAIAQQLLCSSNIILMDEPFSGLDPKAKNEVCQSLLELTALDEYITLIVVTHDIISAVTISDAIWLMGKNRNADNTLSGGASIQHFYNLIEMGLAWKPDIKSTKEFHDFIDQIESYFPMLAGA